MTFKSFEYFALNQNDPMWEVEEVLENKNHPQYSNLIYDIENIDNVELEEVVREKHIDWLLDRKEDKEWGKRVYYIIFKLQKEIQKGRIANLIEFRERPKPYDSENLNGVAINKNHLIGTGQFDLSSHRFQRNNFVYELPPTNGASNSSYWIFQTIINCIKDTGLVFKVRLDPFREIHADRYSPLMYKMLVHGKPLDWGRLLTLRSDEFGQWFNEQDNSFTDYIWAPKDGEIHFTCEEYPSYSCDGVNTSRYFHAIFSKGTGTIKHCDGAVRIYENHELESRKGFHVRQAEVRKIGKRIKIFQFDSKDNENKELSQNNFSQLAVSFFVWNRDVQEYFNGG